MLDFLMVSTRSTKRGVVEVYPKFIVGKNSEDLMIRGNDFYAIWDEENGLWSTNENDAVRLIDKEIDNYVKENSYKYDDQIKVCHMWDTDNKLIDSFHHYTQKQLRDNYHPLDETLIFSNGECKKTDYASKRLSYALEKTDISAYSELLNTLYSKEELHKIEWSIGAIVTGESKKIQKFLVMYGAPGSGKGTVLEIVQSLFDGYCSVFDAESLGSSSATFALEQFKTNPLVALSMDGDLSKIEKNTTLNSLVSHERMTVNEKHKSLYSTRFHAFLLMGTNKPVRITDSKSGIIRRLIDVYPSGNKFPMEKYMALMKEIQFELGGIACHCRDVYLDNPHAYDNYVPLLMMGESNDFFNFMLDSYTVFSKEDGTTLRSAWDMYKEYILDAKVPYPLTMRTFKIELKSYFRNFEERFKQGDDWIRSYYYGFKKDMFDQPTVKKEVYTSKSKFIFEEQDSIFDRVASQYPAQLASDNQVPMYKWDNVKTKLCDIDTHKLHYVKVPENHIVIDFDLKDDSGNKSFDKNIKAAEEWPLTYAELSKSGNGIHLHYIYDGDVSKLKRIFDDDIEVKIFNGNSSLRRCLSKCNNEPIATISSGLPIKEGDEKVINFDAVLNEKALRTIIEDSMNKKHHGATRPEVDFIFSVLENAYNSGTNYDVTDLYSSVRAFAQSSTHQSDYCVKLVNKMKFKSENASESFESEDEKITFYDVEVFPNLLVVNYKEEDTPNVIRLINPSSLDMEKLMKKKLVGFNCRKYDNHIIYARYLGLSNEELFKLSQNIINHGVGFYSEAYNISYADIYDLSSVKQSLKKFEIDLGIHHQELGIPWDKPVPEDQWTKVAEYCDNDVIATEAVWKNRKADFVARQILADLAGGSVNDTTNSLSTKIIFGNERNPQKEFNYRNLGTGEGDFDNFTNVKSIDIIPGCDPEFTKFDSKGRPIFPGYTFDPTKADKSHYRGESVSEGGNVYSEPGMYVNVALLDIASMHPSSTIAEQLFGPKFTKNFEDLKTARIIVKHEEYEKLNNFLDGKLVKYVDLIQKGELSNDDLASALKIVINSVYGLTSAKFDNPFRDKRNIDNIVAKRGALFMVNLRHEVMKRGFTVAHIKTDSIKVPNATPEIIKFITDYGKMYGYDFEHEATYDRMCLVNDAVYIAKYATLDKCIELYGADYVNESKDICKNNKKHPGEWTATGTQFKIPYVFKKCFSKEDITFDDMCETKSVKSAIYIDRNEQLPEGEHNYVFIGKVGQFTPVIAGADGGDLCREAIDKNGNIKYDSVVGTKGYKWLESEYVKLLGMEDKVDKSYYQQLVDDAISEISKYGDYEWFASENSRPQSPHIY